MKVGFIGCGNMGGALARAISNDLNTKIYIFDKNEEKARVFCSEIKGEFSDCSWISENCDFIFLAVKPNIVCEAISSIKDTLNKKATLVSMAAGVKIEKLESYLGFDFPVIRIMPNTPVAVLSGMTTWCSNAFVSEETISKFQAIMSYTGKIDRISEDLIDSATAVAGCGPAFAYMFIDALTKAGVDCGLDEDKALTYASEMLIGSAKMALSRVDTPNVLKEKVCSPGGSTIEGVYKLEEGRFADTVKAAVNASFQKTKKLGN